MHAWDAVDASVLFSAARDLAVATMATVDVHAPTLHVRTYGVYIMSLMCMSCTEYVM